MYTPSGFAAGTPTPAEGSSVQLFSKAYAVRPTPHVTRDVPRLPAPEPIPTKHMGGDCTEACALDLVCVGIDQYVCPHNEEATIHYCTAQRCKLQRRVGLTNVFKCFLTRKEYSRHPRRISHSVNLRLQRQQRKRKAEREADKKDIIELREGERQSSSHQHADVHWDRVAKMYTIIRSVFTHCGLPMSPTDAHGADKVYHELASVCSHLWHCVWDARPTLDADEKTLALFHDNYNYAYHCLVTLYNMRTSSGLMIPVHSTPGSRRMLIIPPHPFVQRYLPEEKQLKARAQILQTKETAMSSNARSAAASAAGGKSADAQQGSMFAIDNKRFTAAREIIHGYLTKWVRTTINP